MYRFRPDIEMRSVDSQIPCLSLLSSFCNHRIKLLCCFYWIPKNGTINTVISTPCWIALLNNSGQKYFCISLVLRAWEGGDWEVLVGRDQGPFLREEETGERQALFWDKNINYLCLDFWLNLCWWTETRVLSWGRKRQVKGRQYFEIKILIICVWISDWTFVPRSQSLKLIEGFPAKRA